MLPPTKTRQVRDHLAKQPVFVVAGKFTTLEEALQRGRELKEKTQGKFTPEVWSSGRYKEEYIYAVVDPQSKSHLHGKGFEDLEILTGADLTVITSELFQERFTLDQPMWNNGPE